MWHKKRQSKRLNKKREVRVRFEYVGKSGEERGAMVRSCGKNEGRKIREVSLSGNCGWYWGRGRPQKRHRDEEKELLLMGRELNEREGIVLAWDREVGFFIYF